MTGAENNTITNVTVQLGATAYLHCHVRSTGDRTLAGAEVSSHFLLDQYVSYTVCITLYLKLIVIDTKSLFFKYSFLFMNKFLLLRHFI